MLIVFLVGIILGVFCQRSKAVLLTQVIICAIVFSFNTDNPDYAGYFGTYYSVRDGGIFWEYYQRYDPLYKLLVQTCNSLGLSFNAFRLLVFFICAVLIILGIRKITRRISLVMSLYMIFPFVMDCIQIRNFLAEAVIVFSVQYLLETDYDFLEKRKCNLFKYLLCVITASLFHYISILYVVYAIMFFRKRFSLFFRIGLCFSVMLSVFLFFFRSQRTSNEGYLATNVSIATFVFLSGITIYIMYMLVHYSENRDNGALVDTCCMESMKRFLKVSLVFLPILIFHYDMFRFVRNVLLVFSGFVGYYISRAKSWDKPVGTLLVPTMAIATIFSVCYGLLLWRTAYYPYEISLIDQIFSSIVMKL